MRKLALVALVTIAVWAGHGASEHADSVPAAPERPVGTSTTLATGLPDFYELAVVGDDVYFTTRDEDCGDDRCGYSLWKKRGEHAAIRVVHSQRSFMDLVSDGHAVFTTFDVTMDENEPRRPHATIYRVDDVAGRLEPVAETRALFDRGSDTPGPGCAYSQDLFLTADRFIFQCAGSNGTGPYVQKARAGGPVTLFHDSEEMEASVMLVGAHGDRFVFLDDGRIVTTRGPGDPPLVLTGARTLRGRDEERGLSLRVSRLLGTKYVVASVHLDVEEQTSLGSYLVSLDRPGVAIPLVDDFVAVADDTHGYGTRVTQAGVELHRRALEGTDAEELLDRVARGPACEERGAGILEREPDGALLWSACGELRRWRP